MNFLGTFKNIYIYETFFSLFNVTRRNLKKNDSICDYFLVIMDNCN